MKEREEGVWIFKNKVNGQMKEIWYKLDYALGEEALKRAEAINAHVTASTNADPIEWDESICGECPFLHICLPDVDRTPLEIIDSVELTMMLNRRAELYPMSKEYEEIDKEVKETVKGKEKLLIGDWLITGKKMHRKAYEVKESDYWQVSIKRA